jgi:hypothetical protein
MRLDHCRTMDTPLSTVDSMEQPVSSVMDGGRVGGWRSATVTNGIAATPPLVRAGMRYAQASQSTKTNILIALVIPSILSTQP